MAGYVKLQKIWPNGTVHIIGSGPSISKTPLNYLRGKNVITCNNAYQLYPYSQYHAFRDFQWWEWHKQSLLKCYFGLLLTIAKQCEDLPGIIYLKHRSKLAVWPMESDTVAGIDTGGLALWAAVHLGATRIVLHGFDMRVVAGRHHWHEDHPEPTNKEVYERRFMPAYASFPEALKMAGVEVLNATPESGLKVFPIIDVIEGVCYG